MTKSLGDKDLKRFLDLEASQGPWHSLYDDCYKYTRPERDNTHGGSVSDLRTTLYDSTAVDSSVKLANRMQDNLVPVRQKWAKFVPGTDVPEGQKDAFLKLLDVIRIRFFQLLAKTNFDTVSNENMQDLGPGQCGLLINPTGDISRPAHMTAVPANQLVVGEGPDGIVQLVGRRPNPAVSNIRGMWPDAILDEHLLQILKNKPDDAVKLIEFCFPEKDRFIYQLWNAQTSKKILRRIDTSNPWVVGRWAKRPGEANGFGPIIEALADIKSLNMAVEMILQNASIELAGIYTATDDGITNPDTIELAPGVFIPVLSNAGGSIGPSIAALPRAANFDLSQIALNDLRRSIRRKLLDDILAPLDDAVRSVEEVNLRKQMFALETGPSFGRLQREYVRQIVIRCLDIWGRMGLLPTFTLDGQIVDIEYETPLAQIQNDIDLGKLSRSAATMEAFALGSSKLALRTGKTLAYIHEKTGASPDLIHSADEIEGLIQQATQAALQDPEKAGQVIQQITQQ